MEDIGFGFNFEITNYCQARCNTCHRSNPDGSGNPRTDFQLNHMDISLFENFIRSLPQDKITHIRLFGERGDPMMHPEIEKFIDSVAYRNITLGIATNGGLRQPSWYSHIAQKYNKKIKIIFGIDGIDHETNWKYRTGVNWDRAWSNMMSFKNNGGNTIWQYIIFPWNVHQIDQVIDIANLHGLNLFFIINEKIGDGLLFDIESKEQIKNKLVGLGYQI